MAENAAVMDKIMTVATVPNGPAMQIFSSDKCMGTSVPLVIAPGTTSRHGSPAQIQTSAD
jgi:hypothetical protein